MSNKRAERKISYENINDSTKEVNQMIFNKNNFHSDDLKSPIEIENSKPKFLEIHKSTKKKFSISELNKNTEKPTNILRPASGSKLNFF